MHVIILFSRENQLEVILYCPFSVTVSCLEGNSTDAEFEELKDESISDDSLCFVFAGLYKLLKIALRTPQRTLKSDVSCFCSIFLVTLNE